MVICEAADAGVLSLSGALTGQLDHESSAEALVQLARVQRSEAEATAAAQVFQAAASGSTMLFIEYQP